MDSRTRVVHAGAGHDPRTGAVSTPIYQTSTFAQEDPSRPGDWEYSRGANPTRSAVEEALRELEGGERGLAFASGMAAITSALLLLETGDHLLVSDDVYGGTYRVLNTVLRRWGLEARFVDTTDPERVRAAVTPRTRALFVETPSNPLLAISDLRALAEIAHQHGLLSMVDNTFMTPLLQRPLELGFDLSLHSATKFLGGHSDLVAGAAVAGSAELGQRLRQIQVACGAVLGPQDSWLLLRGLRTLAVRLEAQQTSAAFLAERLQGADGVRQVHYPGLATHRGHPVHLRQATGPGAVLSLDLESEPFARAFMRAITLPVLAVSLGGVETILSYPVTMSHAAMPPAERERRGITGSVVRLSVGLESAADLLTDLTRALAAARAEVARAR